MLEYLKKLLHCLISTNQMQMDWRTEAFSTQNVDLKLKTNTYNVLKSLHVTLLHIST